MLVCEPFCAHCTRDRGCSVHPAFPAPSLLARDKRHADLGQIVPRECETVFGMTTQAPHSPSSPAHAGDPVRRGFSAHALLPLEYWIARLSRATTSRKCGEMRTLIATRVFPPALRPQRAGRARATTVP